MRAGSLPEKIKWGRPWSLIDPLQPIESNKNPVMTLTGPSEEVFDRELRGPGSGATSMFGMHLKVVAKR